MIEFDTTPHLSRAREIAARRQARAEAGHFRWGGQAAGTNEWGMIGELVVAQYLGLDFIEERDFADAVRRHYDVGGVQVRARTRRNADLGLADKDCKDCIYVLVVPTVTNRVALAGAIRGTDPRVRTRGSAGYVDGSTGPQRRWWVPQDALHPVPDDPPAAFYDGHHWAEAA